MKLKDKVVVVTGGGSGIGRALVLELLGRGARIAMVDLRPEGMAETAALADVGERLSAHVCNVAERDHVAALPAEVVAAHGQVDAVVNNAGVIQPFIRFVDLSYDVIDRMIDVNLYGAIHMLKAFLPLLLERPEAHVANVSSMGGFVPFPGQTMYGAAKAAVKLLSEGLYAELLETNVGVSVVMPGGVDTGIAKNSGVDLPDANQGDGAMKPLPAADAARIMADGIEANRLHVLVGTDAKVMSLATRLAPKTATRLIYGQVKGMIQDPED